MGPLSIPAQEPWPASSPASISFVRAGSPVSQGSTLGYFPHRYPSLLGVSESLSKQESINIEHNWKDCFAYIAHI